MKIPKLPQLPTTPVSNIVLAIGASLALAYVWWALHEAALPIATTTYSAADTAKGVKSSEVSAVPMKSALVLDKAQAVKKLKLPDDVAADPRQQILTAVDVPATKGGSTAVTIIDTDSGIGRTIIKAKERPFISFERGTEIGVRYGVATAVPGQRVDLYARRDLLRIGNATVALYGEANSSPEARAMIDVSLRW